ncbi:hypothetical protein [Streptomyces sp. enrichment culture]|uniref:hypothetical protein n=1 Tax=Streptomyces sp. enrichment culture TaxID=1795815 RepID=UPI003F55BCA0
MLRSWPSSELSVQVNPKYAVTSTVMPLEVARLVPFLCSGLRLPLGCGPAQQGSCADIAHARQSGLARLLDGGLALEVLADAGYQDLGAGTGGRIVTPPHRKFRTNVPGWYEEMHERQRKARPSRRIRVENGIAHLKNWQTLTRTSAAVSASATPSRPSAAGLLSHPPTTDPTFGTAEVNTEPSRRPRRLTACRARARWGRPGRLLRLQRPATPPKDSRTSETRNIRIYYTLRFLVCQLIRMARWRIHGVTLSHVAHSRSPSSRECSLH